MNTWVIGGIIILVLAVGGYFVLGQGEDAMKQEVMQKDLTQNDTMQKDATKDDTMMKATTEDGMMKKEDDAMQKEDVMKKDSEMMEAKGSYDDYSPEKLALAESGKVVLYFHADWCPICRPLDAEMKAAMLPPGVHILKVNYDTATSLKQQYGVTYQHTFVQVDAQGNLVAKWGDATNLAGVLARVK